MLAIGTVSTVLPAYCISGAIGLIGPERTAIIGNVSPVVTVALAISRAGRSLHRLARGRHGAGAGRGVAVHPQGQAEGAGGGRGAVDENKRIKRVYCRPGRTFLALAASVEAGRPTIAFAQLVLA